MDYAPSRLLMWSLTLRMVAMAVLMAGALNWGSIAFFNLNLVEALAKWVHLPGLANIIYGVVGLVALVFLFDRDFYLSFLGKTVYPCGSLKESTPENATLSVNVVVPPNVNVVYWAAEPSEDQPVNNPWDAYKNYSNTGVVKSSDDGVATLKVRPPTSYQVGQLMTRTLPMHVHYRYCTMSGMMSPVYTIKVA